MMKIRGIRKRFGKQQVLNGVDMDVNDGEVIVDINDPGWHTETFINQPYAKPYYAKLNEEFHKGIIIPDSFTMDEDTYKSDLSKGTVIGMFVGSALCHNFDLAASGTANTAPGGAPIPCPSTASRKTWISSRRKPSATSASARPSTS